MTETSSGKLLDIHFPPQMTHEPVALVDLQEVFKGSIQLQPPVFMYRSPLLVTLRAERALRGGNITASDTTDTKYSRWLTMPVKSVTSHEVHGVQDMRPRNRTALYAMLAYTRMRNPDAGSLPGVTLPYVSFLTQPDRLRSYEPFESVRVEQVDVDDSFADHRYYGIKGNVGVRVTTAEHAHRYPAALAQLVQTAGELYAGPQDFRGLRLYVARAAGFTTMRNLDNAWSMAMSRDNVVDAGKAITNHVELGEAV